MKRLEALGHLVFTAAVWVVGLPAALIRDESGSLAPTWRPPALVAVGAVVALTGATLVYGAGRHLTERGVRLFGVRPGPALVTDGPYEHVRNPQDLGSTMMALGPPIAIGVGMLWLTPLLALIYFAAGLEPLENRHLVEEFASEFPAYRRSVAAWIPHLD